MVLFLLADLCYLLYCTELCRCLFVCETLPMSCISGVQLILHRMFIMLVNLPKMRDQLVCYTMVQYLCACCMHPASCSGFNFFRFQFYPNYCSFCFCSHCQFWRFHPFNIFSLRSCNTTLQIEAIILLLL